MAVLTTGFLCGLLYGCVVVGPEAIQGGRLAYNEAIRQTDNQQILMTLVLNRYEERASLLSVASVTANVSVRGSAGVQFGFGDSEDYSGNLVPFAGGVAYEENPTISYVPVQGEKYLRLLTSPQSLRVLAQLAASSTDPRSAYATLLLSVNGIYNPNFLYQGEEVDPRFDQLIAALGNLTRKRRLHWVEDEDHPGIFDMVIDRSDPQDRAMLAELLVLSGLPPQDSGTRPVVIPVSLALDSAHQGAVGVITRSVWDMVEILCAAVEVPPQDLQDGVARAFPPPGPIGKPLQIRYSGSSPDHAYVAVEHRDGWFYIDERDMPTKSFFKTLAGLWSIAMTRAAADGAPAPVLTVPVSN